MQSHHWLNFARVYGSYLIEHGLKGYDNSIMASCFLLEIVKMATASTTSAKHVRNLRVEIMRLAYKMNTWFPPHQKTMMLHLLMFHMPDTIAYWGPARGYWNFPFERNIKHLANKIMNFGVPSLNLVNSYLREKAESEVGRVYREVNDDNEDEDEMHPLIPLGAINSMSNQGVNKPVWPSFSKQNSRYLYRDKHPDKLYSRLFPTLIGKIQTTKGYRCTHLSFICRAINITSALSIGPWTFRATGVKSLFKSGACNQYFAIRRGYVHEELDWLEREPARRMEDPEYMDYDPREIVYGRFHRFMTLELPDWNEGDRMHHIGRCTLWRARPEENSHKARHLTLPPVIDWKRPLVFKGKDDHPDYAANRRCRFVPLQHILAAVALAPMVGHFADRVHARKKCPPTPGLYAAMQLQI